MTAGVRLWRIIAVATAAELSLLSVVGGLLGLLGGAMSEWFDLFAEMALPGTAVSLAALGLTALFAPKVGYRRVLIACAATGVVCGLGLLGPELIAAGVGLTTPKPSGPTLKVVQFNVWRENLSLAKAAATLKAADPDLLAVEETEDFPAWRLKPFEAAFPYRADCQASFGCGLVIYSKRPAKSVRVTRRQVHPGNETSILSAVYDGPDGRPLTVVITHLGWPMPPGAQDSQWPLLKGVLDAAGPNRVLLMGDFNLSVSAHTLRRLEQRLSPLTRRDHLILTYPATIPRARLKWPAPVMAIDHIFATPDLRVSGVRRLGYAGSDHYPVMATIGP